MKLYPAFTLMEPTFRYRAKLDADKRTTLLITISKAGQQDKFKLQSQTIQSVDDLQETYDLQLQLVTLKTHFLKYDLIDVFAIVFPVLDSSGQQTGALEEETVNGTSTTKVRDLFLFTTNLLLLHVREKSFVQSILL